MSLPKVKKIKTKRHGQGYGSGRGGHTSGRGQKGQKTRASIGILFEGLKVKKSFLKRLPFKRGKGKFKAKAKAFVINVEALNLLPDGSQVTVDLLVKNGIVDAGSSTNGIKILGKGDLTKKLTVELPVSKIAEEKIVKAKGQVIK